MVKQFIYSEYIPPDVKFFKPNIRYEVIEKFPAYDPEKPNKYQVKVKDENGEVRGPINIGRPCFYIDDYFWEIENGTE